MVLFWDDVTVRRRLYGLVPTETVWTGPHRDCMDWSPQRLYGLVPTETAGKREFKCVHCSLAKLVRQTDYREMCSSTWHGLVLRWCDCEEETVWTGPHTDCMDWSPQRLYGLVPKDTVWTGPHRDCMDWSPKRLYGLVPTETAWTGPHRDCMDWSPQRLLENVSLNVCIAV